MEKIRLIKPDIHFNEIKEDFEYIFSSGIFSSGIFNKKLQKQLNKFLECKYSFLTSSATTALWVSLKILGIKKGDEVIISDFSFPATANVVEDLGAKPIFADVNLDTFNASVSSIEKLISKKVKAVIFVDTFGNPSGLDLISDLCSSYNIPLIEDAACAIGSKINNKMCGSISDITCFSFHPRKLVCAGEGGAITTNNKEISEILKIKLSHGGVKNNRLLKEFETFGYNFRLSELQCAMSLVQLKKLKDLIKSRLEVKNQYTKRLDFYGFKPQKINENVKTNFQTIVFKVPKNIKRNKLIYFLREKNIETTIGTYSLSNIKYYKDKYKTKNKNSIILMDTTISLPCFPNVDFNYVVDIIKKYMKNY